MGVQVNMDIYGEIKHSATQQVRHATAGPGRIGDGGGACEGGTVYHSLGSGKVDSLTPTYSWFIVVSVEAAMDLSGVLLALTMALLTSVATLAQPNLLGQALHAQSMYFLYQGEVVLTKSTWLVSFSLDMKPYRNQVEEIVEKVKELHEVLQGVEVVFGTHQEKDDQDPGLYNLTAADKAYHKNIELFKMEGEASMKEATALQQLYTELEESFLLPRSVAWSSYVEAKPRLPGRHRTRRSVLSLVGFLLGGVVDIASLVSAKQLRSRVKVLSEDVDALRHATRDSFSILNVTQEHVNQNRIAINKLGEEIAEATKQMQMAFTQLEERTLRELYYAMVNSQIHSYFNVVQNALRRAFTQLVMLRADLNSAALGRMNFGMVSREQLRTTIRKIQNLLPQGYFIPVDEHDLGPLYKHGGVIVFAVDQVLYTTMAIPVARIATEFDVYKLISVPHLREDLGVSLRYKLRETGLAISKDKMTYQIMTAAEATLCGNAATKFCILSRAMYSVTRNPSCLTSLFMKDQDGINRLCEVTRNTGPEHVFAEYLFEGVWLVSSHHELSFSQVCNPQENQMNPEASAIKIKRGSNLVRLKKGCRATSDVLSLPTYFSRSSNEQVKDRFQTEFTNMKSIALFSDQSTYYGKSGGLPNINFSRLPEEERPGPNTLDYWINKFQGHRDQNEGGFMKILVTVAIILAVVSTLAWVGFLFWKWVHIKGHMGVKPTCTGPQTTMHTSISHQPGILSQSLPELPPGAGAQLEQRHFKPNFIYGPSMGNTQDDHLGTRYQVGSGGTLYEFIQTNDINQTRNGRSRAEDAPVYEPFEHIYHGGSQQLTGPICTLHTIPEADEVEYVTQQDSTTLTTRQNLVGTTGPRILDPMTPAVNQHGVGVHAPEEARMTTNHVPVDLKRSGEQHDLPTQINPKRRCMEGVQFTSCRSQEDLNARQPYEDSLR